MQMYVNYFDRFVKQEEERPTVGIVLCKKKHDTLVEITLPEGANIHAREYRLYLPDRDFNPVSSYTCWAYTSASRWTDALRAPLMRRALSEGHLPFISS
jgi:hypothetical protein